VSLRVPGGEAGAIGDQTQKRKKKGEKVHNSPPAKLAYVKVKVKKSVRKRGKPGGKGHVPKEKGLENKSVVVGKKSLSPLE